MRQVSPRAKVAWVLASLALPAAGAGRAKAERSPIARALIAPSESAPITLQRGQALDLTLLSATGLTPPPGLQEPRAHRGLHVALCSDGLGVGAHARACTPLRVDDVRPCDAHSLAYRVRARVESWLGEGVYDLYVRYPGGEQSVQAGVRIGRGPFFSVRVHAGPLGLGALPADARVSPLPAPEGGFALGFVLALAAGSPAPAAELPAGRDPLVLALTVSPAASMREVRVQVGGTPPGSTVFVRSAAGDSAQGNDVRLPAGTAGALGIEVLVVAPDGRTGLLRAAAPVRPLFVHAPEGALRQLAFACSVPSGGGRRADSGARTALSLLALLVSATLGRRAAKARPSVCRFSRPRGVGRE